MIGDVIDHRRGRVNVPGIVAGLIEVAWRRWARLIVDASDFGGKRIVFAILAIVGKEEGVGENYPKKQTPDGQSEFHIVAHAGLLSQLLWRMADKNVRPTKSARPTGSTGASLQPKIMTC